MTVKGFDCEQRNIKKYNFRRPFLKAKRDNGYLLWRYINAIQIKIPNKKSIYFYLIVS